MGYKIEAVKGEPILIETWDAEYRPEVDGPKAAQEIIRLMDAAPEPVTVIVDMRGASISFDDILLLAKSASGKSAPSHHPKQRRRIIVTNSSVVSMAAKGLDHDVFGNIKVDITSSMEDALALARQK